MPENSPDTDKPWLFKPGQSGNPGGRPKGIAAIARQYTDKAMDVLVDAMSDADPRVRVAAAREIIDRGFGKPVTMTADVTSRLDDLDDDAIESALAAIRSVIKDRGDDKPGTGKAVSH